MGIEQLVFPALPRVFGRFGSSEGGGGGSLLPAWDNFSRANGAPVATEQGGLPWQGTMLIVSNALAPNPTYSAELLTDTGLEAWNSATDLTSYTETLAGASTINQEAVVLHGGTYSARLDVAAGAQIDIRGAVSGGTVRRFYRTKYWLRSGGSGSGRVWYGSYGPTRTPGAAWVEYTQTSRGSSSASQFMSQSSGDYSLYYDDLSIMSIPHADIIAYVEPGISDVVVSAILGGSSLDGLLRGVVACWDPGVAEGYGNGLLALYNAIASPTIALYKVVNGISTSLISASATFVSGAALRLVKSGTSVSVYYNGAQIGTTQTVSDAEIVTNTKHGVFVTDPLAPIDNFFITSAAVPTAISDDFNRADGAPGSTPVGALPWVGTMLISGNTLVPNPTYGPELLTDGGMEAWNSATDLTNWSETLAGGGSINQEASVVHGGTYAARADIVGGAATQIVGPVMSALYIHRCTYWLRNTGGSGQFFAATSGPARNPGATWTQYTDIKRGSGGTISLSRGTTSGNYSVYWDDVSVKIIPTSDCVATVDAGHADVSVSAVLLGAASDGIFRGVVARFNTARTDGLVAMYTGAATQQITLHKIVAGVWTSLIAVTQAFVPGAALQIVASGTAVSVYYNAVQIGTVQTVSDTSIINNVHHGVFVTDPLAPVDTFVLTSP